LWVSNNFYFLQKGACQNVFRILPGKKRLSERKAHGIASYPMLETIEKEQKRGKKGKPVYCFNFWAEQIVLLHEEELTIH